jgi:3-oxoacyl-ACP reductase-like protein
MGIFSTILEKLHLKKAEPAATAAPAAKPMTSAPAATTTAAAPAASAPLGTGGYEPVSSKPTPVSEVDVVKQLEKLSLGKGLDWKVSIVDLLKLLDIDSSREARNELAKELGCPADLMSDSAKMNVWLHKTVLQKIAENGGNIPQSLLN